MSDFPDEEHPDFDKPTDWASENASFYSSPAAAALGKKGQPLAAPATFTTPATPLASAPTFPLSASVSVAQSSALANETSAGVDDAAEAVAKMSVEERASLISELHDKFLIDLEGVDLDVQRSDESSPLYSAIEFEDIGKQEHTLPIPEAILKAARAKGFKRPSKIQSLALPILLENDPGKARPSNLIFQSQAGTGKTAAFAINALTRCDETQKHPQVLYTSSTFILCNQTKKVFEELAQFTNITTGITYGSGDIAAEHLMVPQAKFDEQILCATIGKLKGLVTGGRSKLKKQHVKMLVIDEADEFMKKQNSCDDLTAIVNALNKDVQIVLVSATFEKDTFDFAMDFVPMPRAVITVPKQEVTLSNVKQLYMVCSGFESKFESLCAIYESVDVGQTIIYVNTREGALKLATILNKEGYKSAVLTGGEHMTKDMQVAVIKRFTNGADKALVSTDISSRGIDVPTVSLVVNFDLPFLRTNQGEVPLLETYVHRIGRTGRFSRRGTAISLVDANKGFDMRMLSELQRHYKMKIEQVCASKEDLQTHIEGK